MTRRRTAAAIAIALVWVSALTATSLAQTPQLSSTSSSRRLSGTAGRAAHSEPVQANLSQPLTATPLAVPGEAWQNGDVVENDFSPPPHDAGGCPGCGGHDCELMDRHSFSRRLPCAALGARLRAGLSQPLEPASWLYRPLSAGIFSGVIFGDNLISGRVDQDSGVIGGIRLGWDLDPNWGLETRFALGTIEIIDARSAEQLQENDPIFWDTSLLYYPWGETRWRPFLTFGAGFVNHSFVDDQGQQLNALVFSLPFGVGLKRRITDRLAVRGELVDNFSFAGSGVDVMHNVSLSAGLELRFGGRRVSYFPWDPSRRKL